MAEETILINQEQVKVKLIRGQKGAYGYEITVNGADPEEVKQKTLDLDKWLDEAFVEGSG